MGKVRSMMLIPHPCYSKKVILEAGNRETGFKCALLDTLVACRQTPWWHAREETQRPCWAHTHTWDNRGLTASEVCSPSRERALLQKGEYGDEGRVCGMYVCTWSHRGLKATEVCRPGHDGPRQDQSHSGAGLTAMLATLPPGGPPHPAALAAAPAA